MLNISEAQAFIGLRTFLADPDETQCSTYLNGASLRAEITGWPEANHYLMQMYAAASAVCEVLENIRNVFQNSDEVEEEYCNNLNEAIFRCKNVQSEEEKITLYVDGLADTIRMVVARYRETVHPCYLSFESLSQFDKLEYAAYISRFRHIQSAIPWDRIQGRSNASHMGSSLTLP